MTRLMVDDSWGAKLRSLTEDVEVCDPAGQALGHFLPQAEYVRLLCALAESQCPYSKEELARFRQASGGRSLAEVWKKLGAK